MSRRVLNIDERLVRLTERHEAPTHTEESIAADVWELAAAQRESEKRIGEMRLHPSAF